MTDAVIARRLVIHGRVQGVWFRDTMRRVALETGVGGWAMNADDGTVVAFVEGSAEEVARVVEFCRVGPDEARVERVEVDEAAVQGLSGFQIR